MTNKGILRAALSMDAVIITTGHKIFGNTTTIQPNVQCIGVIPEDLVEYPKMGQYGRSNMLLSPPHN